MKNCILILVAAPELEEVIVDWLLEQDDISGFTSHPTYGQSREQEKMSLIEQVIGRQRKVMFHLHLKSDMLAPVLISLQENFTGTTLEYWVIPVIQTGSLS